MRGIRQAYRLAVTPGSESFRVFCIYAVLARVCAVLMGGDGFSGFGERGLGSMGTGSGHDRTVSGIADLDPVRGRGFVRLRRHQRTESEEAERQERPECESHSHHLG